MKMIPVEVATQTTKGQGHDVGTESPNEDDDKGQTGIDVQLNGN